MDMDKIFADVFFEVVLKKINNKSYTVFVERFWPGSLVVGLEPPWLDADTRQVINKKWAASGSQDLYSVFEWVYLEYRDDKKMRPSRGVPPVSIEKLNRCFGKVAYLAVAPMVLSRNLDCVGAED